MKILIDTNIIIKLEDSEVGLSVEFSELFELINKLKYSFFYHPVTIEDINSDPILDRQKKTLSKLSKYNCLPDQESFKLNKNFSKLIGNISKKNDLIDAQLLYSVYTNQVDCFITNDRRLISKAVRIGLEEKVFNVVNGIILFSNQISGSNPHIPISLQKVLMSEVDHKQTFFDTLREDYKEFDDWFERKASEKREAFIHKTNNKIDAILVLNIECDLIELVGKILPQKRRLKVCLMKSILVHNNIGELFIKLILGFAVKHKIDEVYLTHFIKEPDYLIELISGFGFEEIGKKQTNHGLEEVFLKKLKGCYPHELNLNEITKFNNKFYPIYVDNEAVNKFIIPIKPLFFSRLFADDDGQQCMLSEFSGCFVIERNAIKKAYLSKSKINQIKINDLIIFYESENSVIKCIGTVDKVERLSDVDEILKLVSRRTVYLKEEIEQMLSNDLLVILFKWRFNFPKTVSLNELIKNEILKAAPQSINQISHKNYLKIKRLTNLKSYFFGD